jgi:hypothetical protein
MTRACVTLAALFAGALAGCATQQSTRDGVKATPAAVVAQAFPADWCGRWTGTLATLGESKIGPVTMTLEIAPLSEPGRWSWTIIYEGESGRQVRPYELVAVNAAEGRFVIDEKNGIAIPVRVLDGTLYSTFEVMGSRVELRESLRHDRAGAPEIAVEMATIVVEGAVLTGGIADRGIPEVRCWTPRVVQRGSLARQ